MAGLFNLLLKFLTFQIEGQRSFFVFSSFHRDIISQNLINTVFLEKSENIHETTYILPFPGFVVNEYVGLKIILDIS